MTSSGGAYDVSPEAGLVVKAIPTPTLLIEPSGQVLAASDSWHALLDAAGVPEADQRRWLPGTDLLRALRSVGESLPGYTEVADLLSRALDGAVTAQLEFPVPFPSGRRWFIVATSHLAQGLLLVSMTDITDRRAAEAQLAHQATHDVLTGLPNRGVLVERLQQSGRSQRDGEALETAVFFLDLDDFKAINDMHGHDAGDQVLREVARRLTSAVRNHDLVARLGGDEFVVVATHLRGEIEVLAFADRLLTALAPVIVVDGELVSARASIGIAMTRPGDDASESLLRDADIAMLKAKADRCGRLVFSNLLDSVRRHRSDAVDALRTAIEVGAVRPWFQPVVRLADGHVIGAEALARWVQPDDGVLAPADFVPLAERTGLVGPLDRAVWAAAAACLAGGPLSTLPGCSVNASPLQVTSGLVVQQVTEILQSTGLAPERLTVEVTETAVLGDPEAARTHLLQLKALGVRIGLDDFGTGYSSLSHLAELPIDVVKLDRSFVARMTYDRRACEISRAVVGLGAALDIAVIAEGVETVEQRDALLALGCQYAQGYLYGRPVPVARFSPVQEGQVGRTA